MSYALFLLPSLIFLAKVEALPETEGLIGDWSFDSSFIRAPEEGVVPDLTGRHPARFGSWDARGLVRQGLVTSQALQVLGVSGAGCVSPTVPQCVAVTPLTSSETIPLRVVVLPETVRADPKAVLEYRLITLPTVGKLYDLTSASIGSAGVVPNASVIFEAIPVLYQPAALPATFHYQVTRISPSGNVSSAVARVKLLLNNAPEAIPLTLSAVAEETILVPFLCLDAEGDPTEVDVISVRGPGVLYQLDDTQFSPDFIRVGVLVFPERVKHSANILTFTPATSTTVQHTEIEYACRDAYAHLPESSAVRPSPSFPLISARLS